jgi:hypothetical protein
VQMKTLPGATGLLLWLPHGGDDRVRSPKPREPEDERLQTFLTRELQGVQGLEDVLARDDDSPKGMHESGAVGDGLERVGDDRLQPDDAAVLLPPIVSMLEMRVELEHADATQEGQAG